MNRIAVVGFRDKAANPSASRNILPNSGGTQSRRIPVNKIQRGPMPEHRSSGVRHSCVTRAIRFKPGPSTDYPGPSRYEEKIRGTLSATALLMSRRPSGDIVAALNTRSKRLTQYTLLLQRCINVMRCNPAKGAATSRVFAPFGGD